MNYIKQVFDSGFGNGFVVLRPKKALKVLGRGNGNCKDCPNQNCQGANCIANCQHCQMS